MSGTRTASSGLGICFPQAILMCFKDLNSSPLTMHSYHEQAYGEDRPRGLVRVAYVAVSGAVLVVISPARGCSCRDRRVQVVAGCGNEVLGALLLGPPLGALVGGLVGLAAGLLLNRARTTCPPSQSLTPPTPSATKSIEPIGIFPSLKVNPLSHLEQTV